MKKLLGAALLTVLVTGTAFGQVNVSVTDTSGKSAITAKPGDTVNVQVNVDAAAQDVEAADFVLDSTTKSAGAPDLTGQVAAGSTQATVNAGSIFPAGGAPIIFGNQQAPGQIHVVVAFVSTSTKANGPGSLVSAPLVIPANAPGGATYTVTLTPSSGNTAVSINNGTTDFPLGTITPLTITIEGGTPPPPPAGGGLPGPNGDGKVDMNVTDTTANLSSAITAKAGDTVNVAVNVDADAQDVEAADFVLDSTTKSAGAPDLTGQVAAGSTQATVNAGSIFPAGGAPIIFGNQQAPGQIHVVVAFVSTSTKANGPGSLVTVPLVIPANAPGGATYTVKLAPSSGNTAVSVNNGTTDFPLGTLGTATITVEGGPPPPVTLPSLRAPQALAPNTLLVGTLVVQPGKDGTLTLTGANTNNIAGMELVLEYDPAVVTFKSATYPTNGLLPSSASSPVQILPNGDYGGTATSTPPAGKKWLKVVLVGTQGSTQGSSGPLAQLTFTGVAGAAPYTSSPITVVSTSDIIPSFVLGDTAATTVTMTGPHSGAIVLGTDSTGWSAQVGNTISGSASANGSNVYVVDDAGNLQAFTNGAPLTGFAAVKVGGPVLGRPTISGTSVYTLAANGTLTKADAATGGTPAFSVDLATAVGGAAGSLGSGLSSPAVFGGRVYAGLNDGHVVSVADADGKTPAASTPDTTMGAITSGPSVDANGVWVGTNGGTLFTYSPDLAIVKSKIAIPASAGAKAAQLSSAPFITLTGNAYVGGTDGKVYLFNATTGAQTAASDAGPAPIFAPVFAVGSSIVVVDEQDNLRLLDPTTLTQAATLKIPGTGAEDAQAPINLAADASGTAAYTYAPDQDGHLRIISGGATPAVASDLNFGATVSAPAATGQLRTVNDTVVAATVDGSLVALPIYPGTGGVTPPPPPPPGGGLPGPNGDGKVDTNITDTTTNLSSSITAKPGDTVNIQVNVDADAQDVEAADFVLDSTTKSAGAPDLTGQVAAGSTQATVNAGSIFPAGGAPIIFGNQQAPGQIHVVVAFVSTSTKANGPGSLVTLPLVVPASAPDGATYTVKLVPSSGNTAVSINNGTTDFPLGTVGTATITVSGGGTPPPPPPPPPATGGLPGAGTNGAVNVNITDTTANLSSAITAKAGDTVTVQINVGPDAQDVEAADFVLDSTTKSAGAPDLTGQVAAGSTQATVNAGSIFPAGGAPIIFGNQQAPGQIHIVVAFVSTGAKANGPGPLVTVPLVIPTGAPVGATYTLKLVPSSGNTAVSINNGTTDFPLGDVATATITVGP